MENAHDEAQRTTEGAAARAVERPNNRRTEIALREARRRLDRRLHRLVMAMFGILAYSAFGNLVTGAALLPHAAPSGAFVLLLGALYAFGAYHVWFEKQPRRWPVAVPATLTIAILVIGLGQGNPPHPVPLLLNTALLILLPLRARAAVALEKALETRPTLLSQPSRPTQ